MGRNASFQTEIELFFVPLDSVFAGGIFYTLPNSSAIISFVDVSFIFIEEGPEKRVK